MTSATCWTVCRMTLALWALPSALSDGVMAANWITGSDEARMSDRDPVLPRIGDNTYL